MTAFPVIPAFVCPSNICQLTSTCHVTQNGDGYNSAHGKVPSISCIMASKQSKLWLKANDRCLQGSMQGSMQASSSGANGPGQQLALPPEKYAPPPALPPPSTAPEPHTPAALRQRVSPLVKRAAAIADGDRWGLLHSAKQSLRTT